MGRKTISEYWEWNLSSGQKNFVCWAFGALSMLALIFFSFPNTLLFFDSVIDLPNPTMSKVVSVVLSIFVNGLELASLYLLIWKIRSIPSAIIAILTLVTCAFFSVIGTFGSLETSDQATAAKVQKVDYLKQEVANIQRSIDSKTKLLEANNKQIDDLQAQGKDASTRLYNRSIKLSSEIDALNARLQTRSEIAATENLSAPVQALKPEQKKFFNLILAPIIEILMLLAGGLSVLTYKEEVESDDTRATGFDVFESNNSGNPSPTPAMARDSRNVQARPGHHVGFELENYPDRNEKTIQKNVPENQFLYEVGKRKTPSTLTVKNVSETVSKNISKNDSGTFQENKKNVSENDSVKRLKIVFKERFQGKSDPFILYCFDNWASISPGKKRSYGNLTNLVCQVLPSKKTVSKSYVYRVVQANRGEVRS